MVPVSQNKASSKNLSSPFKVQTSRFGEIEVDSARVIVMTSPILGFPESHRFVLRPHGPKSPFMWLQSLDNPDLAFVVVSSWMVNKDYHPAIPLPDQQELQLTGGQTPELLIILTLFREGTQKITANMLGPVVLNAEKRLAKQVLLDPALYDLVFPVD